MPAPATMKQARKFLDLLGGDPTAESLQNLLANGDLVLMMHGADLAKVNRKAFQQFLAGTLQPTDRFARYAPLLLPLSEQLIRIRDYNQQFWNNRLSERQLAAYQPRRPR